MLLFWIVEALTLLFALFALFGVKELAERIDADIEREVGRQMALKQARGELKGRR